MSYPTASDVLLTMDESSDMTASTRLEFVSDRTPTRRMPAHKATSSAFFGRRNQVIISNDIWNPLLHATSMNAGKASPAAPVSLGMINSPEKRSVRWPEKLDNTPERTIPCGSAKIFLWRTVAIRNEAPR